MLSFQLGINQEDGSHITGGDATSTVGLVVMVPVVGGENRAFQLEGSYNDHLV